MEFLHNLGANVKDITSGFRGTVSARAEYRYGNNRTQIQPLVSDDGKWQEPQWFDEAGVVKDQ